MPAQASQRFNTLSMSFNTRICATAAILLVLSRWE